VPDVIRLDAAVKLIPRIPLAIPDAAESSTSRATIAPFTRLAIRRVERVVVGGIKRCAIEVKVHRDRRVRAGLGVEVVPIRRVGAVDVAVTQDHAINI